MTVRGREKITAEMLTAEVGMQWLKCNFFSGQQISSNLPPNDVELSQHYVIASIRH